MAVTKTILKLTHQEAIVKIAGTAGSASIDLQTDLLHANQALSGGTQTVNLLAANWVGLPNSTITVTRGSDNIITVPGDQPQLLDFEGAGYVDSVNNSSDITVTIAGAEAQIYLTLRKASGYASKIETAQFSVYDNRNAVGS